MSGLVTPASIEDAARGLDRIAVHTPLLPAPWLASAIDDGGTAGRGPRAGSVDWRRVRLKCENLQRAGAFKIRGAYTMLSRLPAADRDRGVITYSSGNHAQAVALAARQFGVPAVVVMPTAAPDVKVAGARRLGADVVFEGTTSIERRRRAEAIAEERRLTIVPPFDHPDIIAGQGTVGREILAEWPDVDAVLVPIGGGGLLSGIAAWVRRAKPDCLVIGVEPRTADAMRRSVDVGHIVTLDSADTVADGLAPVRPGELTLAHARALVDDIVTVDDDAIVDAARRLLDRGKIVVEYSGAATVAALLSGRWNADCRRFAAVLSGGNRRIEEPGHTPDVWSDGRPRAVGAPSSHRIRDTIDPPTTQRLGHSCRTLHPRAGK